MEPLLVIIKIRIYQHILIKNIKAKKNASKSINFSDPSLKKYGQVKTSKSEEKSDAKKQNDILLIRLADFINNVVGRRKLPGNVDEKILGKVSHTF